jgi:hypothetical protein
MRRTSLPSRVRAEQSSGADANILRSSLAPALGAAHRQNAALTSFAAWFGHALRAAEPGCFTCRGGRQAFGSPSPAQVSAAFGDILILNNPP